MGGVIASPLLMAAAPLKKLATTAMLLRWGAMVVTVRLSASMKMNPRFMSTLLS